MNVASVSCCLGWLPAAGIVLLTGCSEGASEYPTSAGRQPPYILKEGCSFSIVGEHSRSTIESPRVAGLPGTSAAASISFGDKSITVEDCRVTGNPAALPVYED